MRKKQHAPIWSPVEILELRADRYVYEIQEKLEIYNIFTPVSNKQIEEIFNDVIEIEMQEIEEKEVARGGIYVRRDGTGKYYSLKNICFDLRKFLDFVLNMIQVQTKYRILVCLLFLRNLMEQLGIDLEEKQMAICVALHQASKHYVLTEENIIKCIECEFEESGYIKLNKDEIGAILLDLERIGIILVEDGKYFLGEKLYFE